MKFNRNESQKRVVQVTTYVAFKYIFEAEALGGSGVQTATSEEL